MRAAAKPPPSKPLPPTAVLLCLAGFAFPALRAVRVAPVVVLRQGEQTMVGKVLCRLEYVGRSLLRRRKQTGLAAGVMAAGAGTLTLLLRRGWEAQVSPAEAVRGE